MSSAHWILARTAILTAAALPGAAGPPCAQPQQWESEPNDTAGSADTVVMLPFTYGFTGVRGTIAPAGDVDYFTIPAVAGQRLWAQVDSGGGQGPGANSRDVVLHVIASDGSTVLAMDDNDGTANARSLVIYSADAALVANVTIPSSGNYYLRVSGNTGSAVVDPYAVFIALGGTTTVSESEPNDTPATSDQPEYGGLTLGTLSSVADLDYYAINILAGGFTWIVVDGDPERDGTGTNVALDLYDGFSPGASLIRADSSGSVGSPAPPAEGLSLKVHPLYARVSAGSTAVAGGSYALGVFQDGYCDVPVELQAFRAE